MNNSHNDHDDLRPFLLMSELENGEPISQREIAGRAGLALGLVNSYLKTLVQKGFVTVKSYPRNRYAYLLTPKGFAEKSRLAFQHLSNYNKIYRVTRQESLIKFRALREQGVKRVIFCGLDELTEIAYLSLREAQLQLAMIIDEIPGAIFIDYPVLSIEHGVKKLEGPIVITSLKRSGALRIALLEHGVNEEDIIAPSFTFEETLHSGH